MFEDNANSKPVSPLLMVTSEPVLNEFVRYLIDIKNQVELSQKNYNADIKLIFNRERIEEVKESFSRMILKGEMKLHRFCELLGAKLFNREYNLQSVVIGQVSAGEERFTLSQGIESSLLYQKTDIELGKRLLSELRIYAEESWKQPDLVASFIEYQPYRLTHLNIHKMISRVKAEEEIWNKVCDEIFDIDSIIRKDKKLKEYSYFIKDVFGVKIVVASNEDAQRLHSFLKEISFDSELVKKMGIPELASTSRLSFLETKNHLGENERKVSGWEALKSVVRYWDKTFEIQIQPLSNYFLEREYLTRESHFSFSQKRQEIRELIAKENPNFGFFRDTLQWLFLNPDTEAPRREGLLVELQD